MKITGRDLEILEFLLEETFASGSQLYRRFWKGASRQAAYKRFKELERDGYIEQEELSNKSAIVYQLTKDGYRILEDERLDKKMNFYSHIDFRTFKHDLCLKDARITFYELGLKNWLSERRLRIQYQRSYGWVPDAVILHRNNTRIALELEFTQKIKERYGRIFSYYDKTKDIDAVFYLVDCQNLKMRLIEWAKDYPKLFFGLYDEFIAKREKTIFESKRKRFELKEVL